MTNKQQLLEKLRHQGYGEKYLIWASKRKVAELEKIVLRRAGIASVGPLSDAISMLGTARRREFDEKSKSKSIDEYESYVIDNADYYTATRWLGGRNFEVNKCKTLALARRKARSLAKKHNRIIMVYAVRDAYTAHVENVDPRELE